MLLPVSECYQLQRLAVYGIITKRLNAASNKKGAAFMALGDINFLSWKSKSQQEQDIIDYEKWAFPYGEEQKNALTKLMHEVFPKENKSATLISFLTCKELFLKICKTPSLCDYSVGKMIEMKKYKRLIRKKEMSRFVAIVVADYRVDENLEYPTAAEINDMAKGYEVTKA